MASAYNNVAVAFGEQDKYQEALEMFNQGLAIKLKVYGENHPVNPNP